MTFSKKFTPVAPLSKFIATALFIIFPFVGIFLGINYQKSIQLQNKNISIKQQSLTKEIYPVCIADICPRYSYIDVTGDNTPETTIIIPLAMTQGYGKLVIVEEGEKKLFESEALPGIGVKPVTDGNGFILQYSSSMDENLNRINYEVRYKYEKGKFIRGEQIK